MLEHKEHFHGSDLEKTAKYYGIKKEDIIRFSANVNPLGISYRLRKSLMSHIDVITTYPDREYTALRASISDYISAGPENIAVGNGSTELISLFIQIKNPRNALIVGPTYSEYEREVVLGGGRAHYFQLRESDNFQLDIKGLEEELHSHIDLLVLCNPNNPTSSLVSRNEMKHILDVCKQKDIFVMVDETYAEFTENTKAITAISLTKYYDNIVVLRGISKFFAAPGLRLGYAVCGNHELLKEMNHRKKPWTINSLAAIAGEIMFSDEEYIMETKRLIAAESNRICKLLRDSEKYTVYQPNANFVLLKILKDKTTSTELFETAIHQGMMIRDCSNFPFLNHKFIRFCFMLPEQNDALLKILIH